MVMFLLLFTNRKSFQSINFSLRERGGGGGIEEEQEEGERIEKIRIVSSPVQVSRALSYRPLHITYSTGWLLLREILLASPGPYTYCTMVRALSCRLGDRCCGLPPPTVFSVMKHCL